VSACYWTLWGLLPSLRVTLAGGKLRWHSEDSAEQERRRLVQERVGAHKLLRNALVGCAAGSGGRLSAWHDGRRCGVRGGYGPLRPAALVVRRVAAELAYLASEEVQSVYTSTDAVVTERGRWPSCWPAAGLVVREVLAGEADIRAPGIYRVGQRDTYFYRLGSMHVHEVEREPPPGWSALPSWWGRPAA
jgi:hypothetical protein